MVECVDTKTLYQTASFRGIEFSIMRTDDTFGQRGPTHEYPDRQTPYSEFLGRKAERFKVEGRFTGPDHVRDYDSLRDAVNVPAPGNLVHPVLGTLSVKVESMQGGHDFESGRLVTTFTLDCVEAGSLLFPTSFEAFGFGVFSATETIRSTLESTFAFDLSSVPSYVAEESFLVIAEAASLVADQYAGVIEWDSETAEVYERLIAVRDAPESHASTMHTALIAAITSLGVDHREGEKDSTLERLMTVARFRPSITETITAGPAATQAAENLNTVTMTPKVAAAAEMARLALEDEDHFKSYSEALSWHSTINALLDQEITIAGLQTNDALYGAIKALQTEIADAVHALAPTLPTRHLVNMCHSIPSLLVSHRLYGTHTRAEELEQSNPSASTFFLPPVVEHIR